MAQLVHRHRRAVRQRIPGFVYKLINRVLANGEAVASAMTGPVAILRY